MKLATIVGVVSVCSLGVFQARGAEGEGGFFTLGVGGNLVQDIDIPVAPPVNTVTLEFDPGLRVDATLGYTFHRDEMVALSVAGEVGFMYNPLNRGVGNGITQNIEGDFYQAPFFAKFIVGFNPQGEIRPYIGIGGGGLYSRMDVESIGSTPIDSSGDQTDPAAQAEAGVAFMINEQTSVGFAYKCIIAFPDDIDHFVNHSLSVAFGLHF
jgi:opacity protein-like surface antigen